LIETSDGHQTDAAHADDDQNVGDTGESRWLELARREQEDERWEDTSW